MIFLSVLVISLWFAGYIMTTRGMSNTGMFSDDLEKIISPPTWLYYLCGVPVSKEYPKGTMRVAAFRSQMGGVCLALYFVWYLISRPPTLVNVAAFGFSVLLTFMTTFYVAKHYGLKNRSVIHKRKK